VGSREAGRRSGPVVEPVRRRFHISACRERGYVFAKIYCRSRNNGLLRVSATLSATNGRRRFASRQPLRPIERHRMPDCFRKPRSTAAKGGPISDPGGHLSEAKSRYRKENRSLRQCKGHHGARTMIKRAFGSTGLAVSALASDATISEVGSTSKRPRPCRCRDRGRRQFHRYRRRLCNFGPHAAPPCLPNGRASRARRVLLGEGPQGPRDPPLPWGHSPSKAMRSSDRDVAGWACDGAATPVAASGL